MICKHCHEEVKSFKSYRKVLEVRDIRIIENEPYTQNGYTIEYPKGRASFDFRCDTCGGDLNDKYRECLALLVKGDK